MPHLGQFVQQRIHRNLGHTQSGAAACSCRAWRVLYMCSCTLGFGHGLPNLKLTRTVQGGRPGGMQLLVKPTKGVTLLLFLSPSARHLHRWVADSDSTTQWLWLRTGGHLCCADWRRRHCANSTPPPRLVHCGSTAYIAVAQVWGCYQAMLPVMCVCVCVCCGVCTGQASLVEAPLVLLGQCNLPAPTAIPRLLGSHLSFFDAMRCST